MKDESFPIWYPFTFLVVISLAIYVLHRNWGWWRDGYGNIDHFELWITLFLWCGITFIALLIARGIASGIDAVIRDSAQQEYRVCYKGQMVSLRGSDGVAGSISGGLFMLSGHIGSEQFYNYYTTASDGSFIPGKWKADSNTRVYEENRKDGEVIQWNAHFVHDWVNWFATPGSTLKMDFHIPKGSLKQSFSLE